MKDAEDDFVGDRSMEMLAAAIGLVCLIGFIALWRFA